MNIRTSLQKIMDQAIKDSVADGSLPIQDIPESSLERPRDEANGDWASTVAMRTAKIAKMPPRDVAQVIVDHIP